MATQHAAVLLRLAQWRLYHLAKAGASGSPQQTNKRIHAMKSQWNFSLLILATLCAAGLTARTLAAEQKSLRERGTIENVDAKASRLTLREAHNHTAQLFQWDQNTKFFEHAKMLEKPKAITAGDLKPGE